MRSKSSKCLEFVVGWADGDCTTEPISNLIDFETEEVTEQLIPVLRQYLEVVKRYPSTMRKCWLCDCKCGKGASLCRTHAAATKTAWLIPFLTAWKGAEPQVCVDFEILERASQLRIEDNQGWWVREGEGWSQADSSLLFFRRW